MTFRIQKIVCMMLCILVCVFTIEVKACGAEFAKSEEVFKSDMVYEDTPNSDYSGTILSHSEKEESSRVEAWAYVILITGALCFYLSKRFNKHNQQTP